MTKKETITYWIKQHSNAVDKCSELQAKNERLKEAIRNVPLGEYTEALHDGCDANGAFDCLCEAIQNWETEALKG